ncbi:MAG: 16S rRNA (uracil(1498)-N(3))-methyltransferase [Clostridia bacterium]|nr:16S rRNA (uracil(1498)-N(3))-methyltransferase [Clostridia bacterium]
MPRFFVPKDNISDHKITICGEDVLHIGKVLRLRKGDEITVCDGAGTDYECAIDAVSKKEVIVSIMSSSQNVCEDGVKITLYQSLPKASKMDFVIQKCVELGIDAFTPFISARSVAKGDKSGRYRKISLEAAKQCGRGCVPSVSDITDFDGALKSLMENELAIFAYEEEKDIALKSVLKEKTPKSIGIMIGPEGGFAPEEAEKAKAAGALCVTLGKRILRTETAGMVVLAQTVYELGL